MLVRRTRRYRWLHLSWSLPLAWPSAIALWWATGIPTCAAPPCAVLPPADPGSQLALPLLAASGVILGLPFLTPWTRSVYVRLTTASVVFTGWVAWNSTWMLAGLL